MNTPNFKFSSDVGRRRVLMAMSVLAALLVPAAIAWACNPQARISVKCGSPKACSTFEPGQSMTVYGSYFPGNATITLSGPSGSKPITTSAGGGFSTAYTAPSAPGTYVLTATRPTGGRAPASFTVAAPSQDPPANSTPSPRGGSPGAGSPNSPSFDEPAVNRSPRERGSGGGGDRGETPGARNQPSRGGSGGGSTGGTPGANTPGTVVNEGGQPVFSGSAGPAPANSFGSAPGATGDSPASSSGRSGSGQPSNGAAASEQSATGDVWTGFAPGRTPSLAGDVQGAPEGGKGSEFGLGIALLALGLLALVAGLTAAEVRRRRALARR